jgi:hypothetical protein
VAEQEKQEAERDATEHALGRICSAFGSDFEVTGDPTASVIDWLKGREERVLREAANRACALVAVLHDGTGGTTTIDKDSKLHAAIVGPFPASDDRQAASRGGTGDEQQAGAPERVWLCWEPDEIEPCDGRLWDVRQEAINDDTSQAEYIRANVVTKIVLNALNEVQEAGFKASLASEAAGTAKTSLRQLLGSPDKPKPRLCLGCGCSRPGGALEPRLCGHCYSLGVRVEWDKAKLPDGFHDQIWSGADWVEPHIKKVLEHMGEREVFNGSDV